MGAWEDGFAAGYRSGYENALKTDFIPMEAMKTAKRRGLGSKPKRKVGKYQQVFGKKLKALKKKHPRTDSSTIMKRAHRETKKAMK